MLTPEDYEPIEDDVIERAKAKVATGDLQPEWLHDLPLTKTGAIPRTLSAAIYVLERHPDLAGSLKYNERTGTIIQCESLPWSPNQEAAIDDNWVAEFRAWAEQAERVSWPANIAYDAIVAVARRRSYDPIVDYLRSLAWDGQPRLDDCLVRLAESDDSELARAMVRAWMLSAVRRALEPGCQADHVLVLEGKQGCGKTSLLRVLAGDGFHAEGLPDLSNKDTGVSLQGPWIYELGEMGVLSRHDSEAVKQWISVRIDRYRPPYGKCAVDHPRRMVFAGTTNESAYLRDSTGNRRWWPIRVGRVNVDALVEERDQLWAEATMAALAGEPHWLRGSAAEAVISAQEERTISDPWAEEISRHIASQSVTGPLLVRMTNHEIYDVLGIPVDRRSGQVGQRVRSAMAQIGWIPYRTNNAKGYRAP